LEDLLHPRDESTGSGSDVLSEEALAYIFNLPSPTAPEAKEFRYLVGELYVRWTKGEGHVHQVE